MVIILKGIVQFSNNSDRISAAADSFGVIPSFSTQLMPGDMIKLPGDIDAMWTTVKQIYTDSTLQLTKPYPGTTGTSDYVEVKKNEIKAYLFRKIPDVYKEEISEEDFDTVLNVISSAYLELLPKIKEMKYLYDTNLTTENLLPYIAYLLGYQFDESMGSISSFLQQPILKRNQVANAVSWQKLKGSVFGIKQYLKTLAIEATIKELWYDNTFRDLLDSKVETISANELWQKDIINNSIQLFTGNNGIDTSRINSLVHTIVNGNLIYSPAVQGTVKAEIWQRQATPIAGSSSFISNSIEVTGTGTSYLAEVFPGDKIKLNTEPEWHVVASVNSDTKIILTTTSKVSNFGIASVVGQTKVLKTSIKQTPQGYFVYDTANLLEVNLGKIIIQATMQEPFRITTTSNVLRIKVDGGIERAIIIPAVDTPEASTWQYTGGVVNAINNAATGVTATSENGRIVLTGTDNSFTSTIEILDDVKTAHKTLGFNLGLYKATTLTSYDYEMEYLSIELRNPTDFTVFNAEIRVTYDYLNYVSPDSITDYQYSTGAKSNWFDIELSAKNSSFILLADDVEKVVNKIKTDVKPFHALLRTIRYVSGFDDTWQYQTDQPHFFKDWQDRFSGEIDGVFQEFFRFGFSTCTCQCCLLYDNCITKVYDGKLNYNWISGIYYDLEHCIPRDLLVVYDGYIRNYGGGLLPTFSLSGALTFTQGSDVVSAIGGAFSTQLIQGYTYIVDQVANILYRVRTVIDNDNCIMESNWIASSGTISGVPAINPGAYTPYVYDFMYVASGIYNPEHRLYVYYDGRKYSSEDQSEFCIFHYDLGEYPRVISLIDESIVAPFVDYNITASSNQLLIQPESVKEISGYSDWTNGGTGVTGTATKYTTELTAGDLIKPSSVGTDWYVVQTIFDDLSLDLFLAYTGPNITGSVTDKQISTAYTPISVTLTTGIRTSTEIADEINYQTGQQSVADGIIIDLTLTPASTSVTGVGSNFTTCKSGDWIRDTAGLVWYQINYVIDDNNLELKIAYAGAPYTGTGDKSTPVVISFGIPAVLGIAGFVRILARVNIDKLTGSKGAVLLLPVVNDAYTAIGFDKLYAKAGACYMLYNPDPNSVMGIVNITGEVTMTNSSSGVTGVGTLFTTELRTGDLLKLSTGDNDQWVYITTIVDNFNLTVDGNYQGATGSETDVKAVRNAYDTRLTGNVGFTNSIVAVTGIGTKFTDEVISGDFIKLPTDTTWGEVAIVYDDFNLDLTAGYLGTTGSATDTTRLVKTVNYTLGSANVERDLLNLELEKS